MHHVAHSQVLEYHTPSPLYVRHGTYPLHAHAHNLAQNTHIGIQCPLQFGHVGELLRVDELIWEIYRQSVNIQP